MKKLFAFVAAALFSVATFASREVVPSDADLASYATGTYTMCIYNDGACNGIVLNGTYAGWPNAADHATLLDFVEVTGFEGWYVVSWEDATDPAADGGVQAKPIQLDGSGLFNWDYQLGFDQNLIDKAPTTVIRGNAEFLSGNNGTEVDIKNIQPGILVFVVESWKNNPCTAVYHTYKVSLVSPDCNDEDYITPAIMLTSRVQYSRSVSGLLRVLISNSVLLQSGVKTGPTSSKSMTLRMTSGKHLTMVQTLYLAKKPTLYSTLVILLCILGTTARNRKSMRRKSLTTLLP